MKKILLACLMIAFAAANAEARPMPRQPVHRPPVHHTTVVNKRHSSDYLALGLVTGLIGLAVGTQIAYPQPVYVAEPAPLPAAPANCVTTVDRYNGTTTTTCYNNPQPVREVVYIR